MNTINKNNTDNKDNKNLRFCDLSSLMQHMKQTEDKKRIGTKIDMWVSLNRISSQSVNIVWILFVYKYGLYWNWIFYCNYRLV